MTTPDTPQTGTGALDAAIEAADWAYDGAFMAPIDDRAEHQKALIAAVRAAAPIIERDALQRAADELDAHPHWMSRNSANAWCLRERARVVSPDAE